MREIEFGVYYRMLFQSIGGGGDTAVPAQTIVEYEYYTVGLCAEGIPFSSCMEVLIVYALVMPRSKQKGRNFGSMV